jgi:Ni/Fe-hydrogenase subunit HybB-like protein
MFFACFRWDRCAAFLLFAGGLPVLLDVGKMVIVHRLQSEVSQRFKVEPLIC